MYMKKMANYGFHFLQTWNFHEVSINMLANDTFIHISSLENIMHNTFEIANLSFMEFHKPSLSIAKP